MGLKGESSSEWIINYIYVDFIDYSLYCFEFHFGYLERE